MEAASIWVVVPDAVDISWITHASALSAIAASIHVVLQLLPLLWPRSVAAKIGQIARARRQCHPRSPEDCPQCSAWIPPAPANLVEVVPWKACRSPRGAKKRLSSEGVACPNPECTYFGCAVESIHAMVSCGVRGKTDSIRPSTALRTGSAKLAAPRSPSANTRRSTTSRPHPRASVW
jgi:hypothetical protein